MRNPAEIRPADVADAGGTAAVYRPYVTDSVASFEVVAPDADELAGRMAATPRLPWFVAGRALYERLLPQLHHLGYVTACAGIALPNPGSVRLHEALGFTPVGVYRAAGFKAGRWHDVGWWQLPLRDLPAAPAEPAVWSPR